MFQLMQNIIVSRFTHYAVCSLEAFVKILERPDGENDRLILTCLPKRNNIKYFTKVV